MLEIIKEAGTILKDLPDLAIWILVGVLFYKVFIIGGVISLIKFAINKLHSYLINPKPPVEVIKKYEINGRFITSDNTLAIFDELITEMRGTKTTGYAREYVHKSDVLYALNALRKAKKEEIVKRSKVTTQIGASI